MRKRHRLLFVVGLIVAAMAAMTTSAQAASEPGDIVVVGGTAVVSNGLFDHLGTCTTSSVTRVGDANRFETAARLSERFASADTVFLATGENFPDAIAAGSIAAQRGAPILLTHRDAVPSPTLTALSRLDPTTVVLLGGEAAISSTVERQLAATRTVVRIAGDDRYGTAAAVSQWYFTSPSTVTTVYVALGDRFPDAMVAGPAATRDGAPVLLVGNGSIPTATMLEIERLDPDRIVVVGSVDAVPDTIVQDLAATGATVTRIAGASRWATAANAAMAAPGSLETFIVTGNDFPDGLAAIPVADGAPILFVAAAELHGGTAAAIAARTGAPCSGWTPPYPQVGSGKRVIYTLEGHRLWMIDENENLVDTYPVTGRVGIPHPGTYEVFSKSLKAYAPYGGITMRHMVRFVRPYTWGNRWSYGFHSIPRYADGTPLQTEDDLGSYGSGGCVRQADDKAEAMFAWAEIGTTVIVLP